MTMSWLMLWVTISENHFHSLEVRIFFKAELKANYSANKSNTVVTAWTLVLLHCFGVCEVFLCCDRGKQLAEGKIQEL